jgi:murein tripeptide amidase MpaA
MENINNKARYDNYGLYRFHLVTQEHVELFQEIEERSDSYTFYGHALNPDQNLSVVIAPNRIAEIDDLCKRFGVKYSILERNIQRLIDAEESTVKSADTPAEEFDWNHYFELETIYQWMDQQIAKHDFVTGFEIGRTFKDKPIRGIKISRKPGNTGVFVEAGIHAREWISPATATYIIDRLIRSEEPDALDLSQNFDWYFIPILNADGYKYTFTRDRLWRKNLKPYGRCVGVDLNRNFDSVWNGTGSSSNPCRYDFCGGSVFSEPEAQAIKNFMENYAKEYRIKTYISLHSYSQLYMFPYGYTTEKVSNYDDLMSIGQEAVKAIKETHGQDYEVGSSIDIIYPNSGSSVDYIYEKFDVPIAFTIELRGPKDSTNLFILPADEITPTAEETFAAFLAMFKEARRLGYYNVREEL